MGGPGSGFASMNRQRLLEVTSKGGRNSHAKDDPKPVVQKVSRRKPKEHLLLPEELTRSDEFQASNIS